MKKRFFLFLFLGTVATSFAQTHTISGKAVVYEATETIVDVSCKGGGTCVKLTPIKGGGATRVEIPSIKYDKIIISEVTVNSIPLEFLPIEIPGDDRFLIEFNNQKTETN